MDYESERSTPASGAVVAHPAVVTPFRRKHPSGTYQIDKTSPAARERDPVAEPIPLFPAREEPEQSPAGVSIEFSPYARTVVVEGRPIELTPLQFQILAHLLQNAGRAIPRAEFTASVFRTAEAPDSAKLRVHIHALRRRLGPAGQCIVSVRGKGYGVGL
jgi:DNA-binding response OmpR family regulator